MAIKILLRTHAPRTQHRCRVLIVRILVAHKRMDEARLLQLSHSVLPLLGRGGRGTGTATATAKKHFLAEVLERPPNLQLSHIVLLLEFGESLSLLARVILLGLARTWTRLLEIILLGWTFIFYLSLLRWEMLVDYHFFLDEAVSTTLFEQVMPSLLLERAQHIEIGGLLRFI